MRVAVVDDDASCRAELRSLFQTFSAENGVPLDVASFSSGEAFLDGFDQGRFSIVFMDIFMEGMSGLDTSVRLRELDKRCVLIFLTSSGDHHPEAFSVHAFEYILKPCTPERVYAALRDALAVLPREANYIQVVSERKTVLLFLRDISSVLTDAHYVDIGLTDGSTVRSRMTIHEFLRLVGHDPRFVTVNRGIVINANLVTRFEDSCCIMENGAQFPIRVRDRFRVEQAVRDYHIQEIRGRQKQGRDAQ